jgi:hypothetical protein
VTEIIGKVTGLMGNVMRMLRDEKGFNGAREIKVINQSLFRSIIYKENMI